MFYVGQKVVCVIAPVPFDAFPNEVLPRKDSVYTVREVQAADPYYYPGQTAILLCEIRNFRLGRGEPNFSVCLFRPLTSQELQALFTTGADPSTNQFDNRRKQKQKARV
jgi:hypothetical protein